MNAPAWMLLATYLAVLLLLAWPLGKWLAAVAEGRLPRWLAPVQAVERGLYRLAGVDPSAGMGWRQYALALVLFNFLGVLAVYALQRLQGVLPFNPAGMSGVSADSSFNTALSFVTNTNWQGYGGETTMSYLTQMLALTVQNFLSAATGIVVVIALIRGFAARSSASIGNFWVDVTRITAYVLLPLSLVFALVLVSQGVIQNLSPYQEVTTLDTTTYSAAEERPRRPAPEGRQGRPGAGGGQDRQADAGDGPGRVAGSHQDARHQRRRLLQRQLGAPLREPDAAEQLPADAGHLPDPGGAGVHVRPHGRRHAPGLGPCWRR